MAEDVVNGAQVNATIYYVLSQGYYSQVFQELKLSKYANLQKKFF